MTGNANQTSEIDTTLKVLSAAGGATTTMLAIYYVFFKPRITGWIQEGSIGQTALFLDSDQEDSSEIMLRVTVTNRRRYQGAIVEWILKVEDDKREYRPSLVPDSYTVVRAGLSPNLAPTRLSEGPPVDIRTLTSQPFKTASGWLRFAFPGVCELSPRITLTMVDHLHRKHKIKGRVPYDGGLSVGEHPGGTA